MWKRKIGGIFVYRLLRHGIGSDGILLGPIQSQESPFRLRIFNPDGSEAEKSGNGLCIFTRYLWDQKCVNESPFTILTPGGAVTACVHPGGKLIDVDMGKVSFHSRDIPVQGPDREVLNETMRIDNQEISFCAATIGNPHCVLPLGDISKELACQIGPVIENESRFPNRTNVQLLKALDRYNIQIEIWERGAGYTLASGSSSCAAATAAYKLGLVNRKICVHMPGGSLDIEIDDNEHVQMIGTVSSIANGNFSNEMWSEIIKL